MNLQPLQIQKVFLGLVIFTETGLIPVNSFDLDNLIQSFCLANMNSELKSSKTTLTEKTKLSICDCVVLQINKGYSIDNAKSTCITDVVEK